MAEGEGTVLVVDDDGGVRRVAETLLQRHGYHVVCATNGREAVECLRLYPGRFRAVLLDLTMPVMGGSEALRHLRELEPALPVILMSGYSDAHVEQTFADSDLAGFLQKPFRAQELYAALSIALATK
jgi:CheY-like chemotaxis protein